MHGDIVDIVAGHGGHLATLHLGDPVVGMEDKDIDILTATAAFNSGGSGVTGGGTHNHHFLVALVENIVEQVTEKLQGKVLKRQGRALEQLHNPLVVAGLDQWGNAAMTECGVGLVDQLLEVGLGNSTINKGAYHLQGQLLVGESRPGGDLFLTEYRQFLGHIESTVRCQTGQYNIFKILWLATASGADIFHLLVQVFDADKVDTAAHCFKLFNIFNRCIQ